MLGRARQVNHTHRSSESAVVVGMSLSTQETSTSPGPFVKGNTTRRTSVYAPSTHYGSPEYDKPSTPYEDKVIPTLRNRGRTDGNHANNPLTASTDPNGTITDETADVLSGMMPTAITDDATAELNQAEMIEANQMMIVFDKQLVRYHSIIFFEIIIDEELHSILCLSSYLI
jgi:hypothetical protein